MTDPAEVIRKALERWVYPEQNETDPEVRDALAALSELTAERDEARIEAADGLAAFRLAQEARDKWRADHDKVQAERDRLTGRIEAADERLMDTLEVTSGWHSRLGPFKGRDDESWNAVSKSAEDALNILRAAPSQPDV